MELREMDVNLQSMMLQNVPSIELNRRLIQNEINVRRVADIIHQASLPDSRFLRSRKRRNQTSSISSATLAATIDSFTVSPTAADAKAIFRTDINELIEATNATHQFNAVNRFTNKSKSKRTRYRNSIVMLDVMRDTNNSEKFNYSDAPHDYVISGSDAKSPSRRDNSSAAWSDSNPISFTRDIVPLNETGNESVSVSSAPMRNGSTAVTSSMNATKSVSYCPAVPPGLGK